MSFRVFINVYIRLELFNLIAYVYARSKIEGLKNVIATSHRVAKERNQYLVGHVHPVKKYVIVTSVELPTNYHI